MDGWTTMQIHVNMHLHRHAHAYYVMYSLVQILVPVCVCTTVGTVVHMPCMAFSDTPCTCLCLLRFHVQRSKVNLIFCKARSMVT